MKGYRFMLALFLGALLLSGCSGKTQAPAPQAAQEVLKIGVEGAFPPFNFFNKENKLVGFEIDLAEALCAKLGMKPEFVPTEWSGIMTGLLAKKYDCIIASMTITEERKQKVNFSVPYYVDGDSIVVRADDTTVKGAADLKGKTVGATVGTTQEEAAKALDAQYGLKAVKLYPSDVEGIADLLNGRLDAFVAARLQVLYRVKESGEPLKVVGEPLNRMEKGVAVRKEDTQLLERINKGLEELFRDGTYASISQKWFGQNILGR